MSRHPHLITALALCAPALDRLLARCQRNRPASRPPATRPRLLPPPPRTAPGRWDVPRTRTRGPHRCGLHRRSRRADAALLGHRHRPHRDRRSHPHQAADVRRVGRHQVEPERNGNQGRRGSNPPSTRAYSAPSLVPADR